MRIVNLEEFRKLPDGTVFCKYEPCIFGELEIFGGLCGDTDYISAPLTGELACGSSNEMFDILDRVIDTKESFNLDVECWGRDGLYEKDQLYAIYEKKDLEQLIDRLKKSLEVTTTH